MAVDGELVKDSKDGNIRTKVDYNQSIYSNNTDFTKFSKASGAGVLTRMLNPKNFTSLKALETLDREKLYIESVDASLSNRRSKKKITIIQKKKRDDGSMDINRQEIYKDYGASLAYNDSKKHNSALDFYRGSSKAFRKINEEQKPLVQNLPNGGIKISTGPTIKISDEKQGTLDLLQNQS